MKNARPQTAETSARSRDDFTITKQRGHCLAETCINLLLMIAGAMFGVMIAGWSL